MKLSPIPRRAAAGVIWSLASGLLLGTPAARAAAVQVMLFGQPCQITGPASVTEAQLTAIHQVSPEQTPFSETPKSMQASLDKLKASSGTPALLSHYIEQRTKALQARISFEEGLDAGRKARNPAPFAEATQKLLHPKRHQALVRAFEKALKAGNSPHAWEQLRMDFAESAEPDGEEDFHRALRKLKVVYQCSFEEAEPAPKSGA